MKNYALWLSASALVLGCCGAASAQTTASAQADSSRSSTVEEVVVTAERRSTSLQKTAIAATVLTGKDLIKQGVMTEDQLQFVSPSLTVDNFGQGNDFDIRGIGKGEHNTQTGTGVVTYRDGVATFPGYFGEEPYFDVADVEVLRGPQGTFSGQNATGGAVIVNTQNPVIGGGYDGYVLAHYGNYNDTGAQGAVNLPISDTLAARVAFNADYRDTFYKIAGLTGDPNTMWGSGRFSLLWTPTNSLKVLFKTDYDYLDNGGYFGDALVNAATHQTNSQTSNLFDFANNYKTFATDQFVRSILRVDYTNADGIDFRSISGFQQGRSAWKGDIDGTNATTASGLPNYAIDEGVDETVLSQEFNIISPTQGPLTWVVGAFYQHNEYNFPAGHFDIAVPPGEVDEELFGTNITQTEAVFGQISYDLPEGFQLQVGARYSGWSTWNGVTYLVPEFLAFGYRFGQNQSESGTNLSGKVTLNWNLDSHNFLYAFIASGEKPGGLNTALYFSTPPGIIPAPFGQETVTDYELGWKSSMLDNHLHTQLGVYYNLFHDFQVILPIPNDPVQATETNDPNATKLYGLEASAQGVFGDFSFNLGLGLEHSSLGTFYAEDNRVGVGGTCNPQTGPANGVCINLSGHPQTYAPDLTFEASAQYVFKLQDSDTLTPSINYSHISSQWATLFDNRAAGDYLTPRDVVGAQLAWAHDGYIASLYGYNLLDDHYVSAVLSPIRIAGAPRQFGVSLMKPF